MNKAEANAGLQAMNNGTWHELPSGRLVVIYYGQTYIQKPARKPR